MQKLILLAVNNSGTTALQVNDPRSSDKKTFGNPYQYVFQQMMDETIADENVYEIPETRGKQGERHMHSDVRRLVAVLLLILVRTMVRAVSMQFIIMVILIRMICAVTLHVR